MKNIQFPIIKKVNKIIPIFDVCIFLKYLQAKSLRVENQENLPIIDFSDEFFNNPFDIIYPLPELNIISGVSQDFSI